MLEKMPSHHFYRVGVGVDVLWAPEEINTIISCAISFIRYLATMENQFVCNVVLVVCDSVYRP